MSRTLRTAIVLGSVLLAGSGGTGAAQAQELAYADSASDVYLLSREDASTTLHGDMVNTDVTSVSIDHRKRRLTAKFGFTDLDRTGQGFITLLEMRTSDGLRPSLTVLAIGAPWRGWSGLSTRHSKDLECPSMRHAIDYEANTVKVSMRTRCIGTPRWVQVALLVASIQADNTRYLDDAQHPDIHRRATWLPTWSSKIRRG